MLNPTHNGIPRKLCTGCHKVKALGLFANATKDFPTRDGKNYCCRECNQGKVKYRVVPGKTMKLLEKVL